MYMHLGLFSFQFSIKLPDLSNIFNDIRIVFLIFWYSYYALWLIRSKYEAQISVRCKLMKGFMSNLMALLCDLTTGVT